MPRVINEAAKWVSPDFATVSTSSPPAKKHLAAIISAVGFSLTKMTSPLGSTKRSLLRLDIVVIDKIFHRNYKSSNIKAQTCDKQLDLRLV